MTDGTGTTTYEYDHRNRSMQKNSPVGTVGYTYDGIGKLTSKTDAGDTVLYKYDEVNRLHYLLDHDDPPIIYDRYDDNDRPVKVIYPHFTPLQCPLDFLCHLFVPPGLRSKPFFYRRRRCVGEEPARSFRCVKVCR
jgi:YD repeat-containing protein